MNIKPDGMTIPDCKCFNNNAKKMNNAIDKISTLYCMDVVAAAALINLCDKSMDYYIANIIWPLLALRIKRSDNDTGTIEEYRLEFEKVYDRLRPLIMERITYADGVLMEKGG